MDNINRNQLNDQYFDLKLNGILVHKNVVCNQSKYLKTLLEWEQKKTGVEWPPVNELNIILPDNITPEQFDRAINYLYNKKFSHDDVDNLINTLLFLMVNDKTIISILDEYLPVNDPSLVSPNELNVLKSVIKTLGEDNKLILPYKHLFGKYLPDFNADKIWGIGIKPEILKSFYEICQKSDFHIQELPEYKEGRNGKWFYFSNVKPRDERSFEWNNIIWNLKRYNQSWGYGKPSNLVKVYADESTIETHSLTVTHSINIRCYFIIYSTYFEPEEDVVFIPNCVPADHCLSKMVKNYSSNFWGIDISDYQKTNICIAMFVEEV